MTRLLTSIFEIADDYDVIVFDQFGVLHDGARAYPGALQAVEALRRQGRALAVLSNSGKRGALNLARIAGMGFAPDAFVVVTTSGEALWQDIAAGALPGLRAACPVAAHVGDARAWAEGLADFALVDDIERADCVLLMGLPEPQESTPEHERRLAALFDRALARGLPVLCSNPDLAAPRGDGRLVRSPGLYAQRYREAGGRVRYYGKPYPAVYRALERAAGACLRSDLAPRRFLMVGDSLTHDVAGARAAGWGSLLARAGLHADEFAQAPQSDEGVRGRIARLSAALKTPAPDYSLVSLGPDRL